MESMILILIIGVLAIITWLIAGLIDEVKELKIYNKHYKNMIRAYQEELQKKAYIKEIKKECNCWNSYTKKLK